MKRTTYSEMSSTELAKATRQFDEPDAVDRSRALTPEERKQWRRAKAKRGRPRLGQGFQRISVSLEKSLLRRATTLAKQRHVTRSKLLAELLERELARVK